jgi:hypothetical protein
MASVRENANGYSYNTSVHLHFMLAEGLRSHSVYSCAGCILSVILNIYRPRDIPVQVKDECRL